MFNKVCYFTSMCRALLAMVSLGCALCLVPIILNKAHADEAKSTLNVSNHIDKITESQNVRKSWKGKTIVPEPYVVFEDSSELLREGKRAYMHIALGVIATEVAIGAYLTPDSIFDVRYLQQADLIAGESMMISASYSRFVSNSLFLRGGIVNRVGTVIDYLDSFAGNRGQKTSSDIGIDLAIGNRWQWKYFVVGGEWFAVTLPLIGKEYDDFDFQFRVLMMHVGVSF